MRSNVHVIPSGLQDGAGVPASSKVTANQQVSTSAGTISLISDVFTWPGPSTSGNFLVPMKNVLINSVPAINAISAGQALNAAGSPVPTTVTVTDQKVSGQ